MQDTFSGLAWHFPMGVGLRSLRGSWGSLARSSETHTHAHTHTQGLSCRVEENPLGAGGEKWKWESLSRVRLCHPMDYTAHGILQARILEWVAFPFSRVSSQPRDWTQVSLFLTQDLNWGLPHCRQILYQLSYQVGKGQSERGRASRMVMWNGQSLGNGKAKHQPLSSQGRGQSWVKSPRGVSAFFPPEFSLSKEFSLYFIERWGLKP